MKKKLLVLFMVAALAILTMAIFPNAATLADNGLVGTEDGTTFTISGQGDIPAGYRLPAGYETLIIEEGITSIPDAMCINHANLVSVSIPSSVTSIGANAFRNIKTLRDVILPSDNLVASVGKNAFRDSKLTAINFSDSLRTIGDYAFMGCTNLSSINLGDNLESMGREAFRTCINLTSIDIRGTITEIPQGAFYSCYGLTSVTMGDSITSIKGQAFRMAKELSLIDLSANLETIGDSSFYGTGMNSVDLPDTVTTLGNSCFYGSEVASIDLSNKLESIPKYCFASSKLVSVAIPDSVKRIETTAFRYSTLSSVDLGNGVEYIGPYAFATTNIQSVVIPASVTTCGTYTFFACNSLETVTFEEGLKTLSQRMFQNCAKLSEVNLADSITTIDISAFYDCKALATIELPENLLSIKSTAFGGSGLTSIDIPGGVKTIEAGAFRKCSALTQVVFNDGTETIAENAFAECPALASVTFGAGLKTIGASAFRGSSVASITIPDGCVSIDNAAFYQTKLTEVTLPASIEALTGKIVFTNTAGTVTIHTSADAFTDYITTWATNAKAYVTLCPDCPGCFEHKCTFGEWAVTVAPTVDAAGLLTKTCTSCDITETYDLPALNNTDYAYSTVTLPTCVDAGEAKYTIVVDEQSFDFAVALAATGVHTYGEYVVTTPATPFSDGVETSTCVCGDAITRPVAYVGETIALDVQVSGTTVTATVKLVNAPELSSLGFSIAYADKLALTSAETILDGYTADPAIANPVKFAWVNGLENVDLNGDVLVLTFTITEGTEITAEDFTITYDPDDNCYVQDDAICNVDLDTFVLVTVA